MKARDAAAPAGLARLWSFYRPHARRHRGLFARGILGALGMVLVRLALPWPLVHVVGGWLAEERPAGSRELLVGGLSFAALYALLGFLDRSSRADLARFAIFAVRDLRAGAPGLAADEGRNRGDFASRLVGDAARLKEGLKGFLVHVATNGMLLVGVVAVILFVDAVSYTHLTLPTIYSV